MGTECPDEFALIEDISEPERAFAIPRVQAWSVEAASLLLALLGEVDAIPGFSNRFPVWPGHLQESVPIRVLSDEFLQIVKRIDVDDSSRLLDQEAVNISLLGNVAGREAPADPRTVGQLVCAARSLEPSDLRFVPCEFTVSNGRYPLAGPRLIMTGHPDLGRQRTLQSMFPK